MDFCASYYQDLDSTLDICTNEEDSEIQTPSRPRSLLIESSPQASPGANGILPSPSRLLSPVTIGDETFEDSVIERSRREDSEDHIVENSSQGAISEPVSETSPSKSLGAHSARTTPSSPPPRYYAKVQKEPSETAFPHLADDGLLGMCLQRPFRHSRARGGPFAKNNRPAGKPSTTWHLRQFAEATLGSGSLRKAVKLPEGEDINEWLAVNVVDFYNQINLLYGSVTEFCSPQTCPEMKATDEFEYLWQDSQNFKKPTKMPAPEYVEHLMAWCQTNIDNEEMFPSRLGVAFPKGFSSLVRQMFKRLYRVYAHIYCHHYPVIIQLGLEPHLNTSFKHYVLFIDEHQLASGKDYWGPLGDLVESMLKSE